MTARAQPLRDRATRRLRWRLRRLRPGLRKPVVAWRHAGLEGSDSILASYPRSGSRWMEIMLGELLVGHEIDFYEEPYPIPFSNEFRREPDTPRPLPGEGRLIKTHEAYREEYRRAVYLVRHPGDVAVSYYRHLLEWTYPELSFDRWFQAWIRGQLDGFGSWRQNVGSWLDAPVPVKVIRYEELSRDPAGALRSALELLGVDRDRAAIERAVANNSMEAMTRKQEAAARSLVVSALPEPPRSIPNRRGSSDVWRTVLSKRQAELLQRDAGPVMDRLGYELR